MANNNGLNNRYTQGFTTQAGVNFTPIVLTAASNQMQVITGTAVGASFTLPVESTMPNGWQFTFINLSNQSVSIASSGLGNVATLPAGANAVISLVNNSVTTSAAWSTGNGVPLVTSYVSNTSSLTVTFGGGSPGTISIANVAYTKINALVFVNLYIAWSNKTGAATGDLLISGLPYQSISTYTAGLSIANFNSITYTNPLFARVNVNSTTVSIAQIASNATQVPLTDANIGATTQINLSGCYITNS